MAGMKTEPSLKTVAEALVRSVEVLHFAEHYRPGHGDQLQAVPHDQCEQITCKQWRITRAEWRNYLKGHMPT